MILKIHQNYEGKEVGNLKCSKQLDIELVGLKNRESPIRCLLAKAS